MFMVTKANKSPKKTRKQRVKHITKTDTHFMVRRSLLVYAILVFVLFWLTAMSVYLVDRMVVEYTNTARYNQIHSIYSNLIDWRFIKVIFQTISLSLQSMDIILP